MSTASTSTPNLTLPSPLSPDSLDVLTDLASILSRVRYTDTSASVIDLTEPSDTLTIREFLSATDQLRHNFQRARAEVKALPDMQRSIEEQEKEMKRLEDKIEAQKRVLARLKAVGAAQGRDEDEGKTETGAG